MDELVALESSQRAAAADAERFARTLLWHIAPSIVPGFLDAKKQHDAAFAMSPAERASAAAASAVAASGLSLAQSPSPRQRGGGSARRRAESSEDAPSPGDAAAAADSILLVDANAREAVRRNSILLSERLRWQQLQSFMNAVYRDATAAAIRRRAAGQRGSNEDGDDDDGGGSCTVADTVREAAVREREARQQALFDSHRSEAFRIAREEISRRAALRLGFDATVFFLPQALADEAAARERLCADEDLHVAALLEVAAVERRMLLAAAIPSPPPPRESAAAVAVSPTRRALALQTPQRLRGDATAAVDGNCAAEEEQRQRRFEEEERRRRVAALEAQELHQRAAMVDAWFTAATHLHDDVNAALRASRLAHAARVRSGGVSASAVTPPRPLIGCLSDAVSSGGVSDDVEAVPRPSPQAAAADALVVVVAPSPPKQRPYERLALTAGESGGGTGAAWRRPNSAYAQHLRGAGNAIKLVLDRTARVL